MKQNGWNGSIWLSKSGQIKGIKEKGKTNEHSIDKICDDECLNHNFLNISQHFDKGNKVSFSSTGAEVTNHKTKEVF